MQFAFKTRRRLAYCSIISSLICTTLYILVVYEPCISAAADSKAAHGFDDQYSQASEPRTEHSYEASTPPNVQIADNKNSAECAAVYGMNYLQEYNFLGNQDQQNSKDNILGISVKTDNNPRYNIQNHAWNWEYSGSNFTLSGESSLASNEESANYNINWLYPIYVNNNIAHKIAAEVSHGSSQWEIGYEIVPPQYISLLNAATPDQEKFRAKWRNRLGADVNYHVAGLWLRDKIGAASTAAYRTYSSNPEAGIIVQRILGNPNAFLNVNYSQSNRTGGGSEGQDGSWTVGYQDIFGKVNIQTSVSNTNSRNSNNRMDISKNSSTAYNASLSTSYKRGRYIITPTVTWGYYQQNNLLSFEQEKTYETSLALDTSEPGAAFSSLIKFGRKKLISPSRGDSPQWFVNLSIEWVPPFLTENPGSKIYFRALINDYKYDNSPSDNYRENSYSTGFSKTF